MKTFLMFHLVGYNSQINDENLTDRIDVKLVDTNENSARERAQKLAIRNAWFLVEITEFEQVSKESHSAGTQN